MRHSLRFKFTIVLAGITAFTIAACLFINQYFLEDYYLRDKMNTLKEAYSEIDLIMADKDDETDAKMLRLMHRLSNSANISFFIMGGSGEAAYASSRDVLWMKERLQVYAYLGDEAFGDKMESTNNYSIIKTYDSNYKSYYMEMWGFLSSGDVFLMNTPIESIRESVAIANRFYTYIGVTAIIISAVLIYFMTRKLTKPILQLAGISRRMSDLDFDVKYNGKEKNEIGILGGNINDLAQKLEHTITELKSANRQLQCDIDEKIQIDDMRKEFISNVSHELKTPIALIRGYAEGLNDCVNEDEESRQFYCEVIMDEADKMNQMVKKLLNLNQIEYVNQVQRETFDLTELIRGVLHSTEILAQQKGADIRFSRTEPVFISADEFMIEEVVSNYVSNALNHLDYDRVIDIRMDLNDTAVKVSVFNTGDPIPEEDLEKVWIKFYKVDKARTREYGGSGIGLSIVKAIMDAHKGKYGVENRENGVCFWFELETQNS